MNTKPLATSLALLGSAAVAHAAVVTTFNPFPGGGATNTFTVSADGSPTTASSSGNAMGTAGTLEGGTTGTFAMTWTAEDGGSDGGAGRLPWNAATFTGEVGTGFAWNGGIMNYGPQTLLDGTINLVTGEAIRMVFDLSSLSLAPGQYLQLDGIQMQNSEPAGVFSFNDVSTGMISQVVGSDPGQIAQVQGDNVFQPLNLIIEDGDQVAIWRPSGGGQVRTYGFTASVVPEPSSLAMAGLGLGGLLLRRRRAS